MPFNWSSPTFIENIEANFVFWLFDFFTIIILLPILIKLYEIIKFRSARILLLNTMKSYFDEFETECLYVDSPESLSSKLEMIGDAIRRDIGLLLPFMPAQMILIVTKLLSVMKNDLLTISTIERGVNEDNQCWYLIYLKWIILILIDMRSLYYMIERERNPFMPRRPKDDFQYPVLLSNAKAISTRIGLPFPQHSSARLLYWRGVHYNMAKIDELSWDSPIQ